MMQLGSTSFVVGGVQVFHDHADTNTFWYLPAPVTMGTRPDGSPAFTLMVFKPGPDGSVTKGGGFLTFESMLTLSDEARAAVLGRCRALAADPARDVSLSPVPFDAGTVECIALNVQGPGGTAAQPAGDGSFDAVETILGAQVPELFGDDRAAFSLMLSQEGSTIVRSALAQGGAPVGVIYKLQFTALRPALHVKITADLDRVYTELGANLDVQVYWVKAGIDAVFQKLHQEGVIKIESTVFSPDAAEQEKWALDFFTNHLLKDWFEPSLGIADVPKSPGTAGTAGGAGIKPGGATGGATGGTTGSGTGGKALPGQPTSASGGTSGGTTGAGTAKPLPGQPTSAGSGQGSLLAPQPAPSAPPASLPAPSAPPASLPAPSAPPVPPPAAPAPMSFASSVAAASGSAAGLTTTLPGAPKPGQPSSGNPAGGETPGLPKPATPGKPTANPAPKPANPADKAVDKLVDKGVDKALDKLGLNTGDKAADKAGAKKDAGPVKGGGDSASVSFKLKFVHQEERKHVELVYDRTEAVQRTYAPQGFFGDLGAVLLEPSHLIEIDLDDPFFRKLGLTAQSLVTDYADLGLQTMDLHLTYGRPDDPGGVKRTDLVFAADSPVEQSWEPLLNAHLDTAYDWALEYHFDPGSGWHGADVAYTFSGRSEDQRIELTPYNQLGFLDVVVAPGDLDEQIIRSTDVLLGYTDPGGWTRSDVVTVLPGNEPQHWRVRSSDRAAAAYTCTFRHTLVDGTVVTETPEPLLRSASSVVVNDPFPDHLEISLLPAWTGAVRTVVVDVEYETGGRTINRRVELDGADTSSHGLRIGMDDPSQRSFTWRATFIGMDGVATTRQGVSTTDTLVRVSPLG